jgi:hypothetical protein
MLGAMDALADRLRLSVFACLDQDNVSAATAIVVSHRDEADAAFWQDLLHVRIVEVSNDEHSRSDPDDATVDVAAGRDADDSQRGETVDQDVVDSSRVDGMARMGNGRGKRK